MSFIKALGRSEVFVSSSRASASCSRAQVPFSLQIRYVQRLVTCTHAVPPLIDMLLVLSFSSPADHVALGNEIEAGLTLKLHADLHEWNLTTFVDAIPDLDLPRQTEFARKE